MRPGRRRALLVTAGSLLLIGALMSFSWALGTQGELPASTPQPTTAAPTEGASPQHPHGSDPLPSTVGDTTGVSWKGKLCMAGTNINTDKVRGNCAKGAVAKPFCDALSAAVAGEEVCGQYAEGKFAPASQFTTETLTSTYADLMAASGVSNVSCIRGGMFHFDGSLQLSHSQGRDGGCEGGSHFTYLSPAQVIALLHRLTVRTPTRRGILFSGDSMVRQLFLGVVSLARGTTVVSEHYFHQDGLYLLHMDGRDEIVVLTPNNKQKYASVLAHFFQGYQSGGGSGSSRGTVRIAMMFMWDIKPSTYRKEAVTTMAPYLSTHIASFMYWWNNKGRLEEIEPYLSVVRSNLLTKPDSTIDNSGLLYRFVNTPPTAPKTFGGVDDAVRMPRNKRVSEWTGELESALLTQDRPVPVVVDYAAIAEGTKAISKTKDGIHYSCIWTPKYPEQVSGQKDNGRGCTDPMNTAVAQWLLRTLLIRLK